MGYQWGWGQGASGRVEMELVGCVLVVVGGEEGSVEMLIIVL